MGYEEGAPYRAIVWIQPVLEKHFLVIVKVVVVHRAVKGQYDHLRSLEPFQHVIVDVISFFLLDLNYLLGTQSSGNLSTVSRTEAIGQLASRRVTALGQINWFFGDWGWSYIKMVIKINCCLSFFLKQFYSLTEHSYWLVLDRSVPRF